MSICMYYHFFFNFVQFRKKYFKKNLPLINAPFMLEMLVLMSERYPSRLTYSSSCRVLDRHWMTEFMKHVLPMFLSPLSPRLLTGELGPRSPAVGDRLPSRSRELVPRWYPPPMLFDDAWLLAATTELFDRACVRPMRGDTETSYKTKRFYLQYHRSRANKLSSSSTYPIDFTRCVRQGRTSVVKVKLVQYAQHESVGYTGEGEEIRQPE